MTVQPSDLVHAPMGGTLVPDGATFRGLRATAVHLPAHVLPQGPLRQWVGSLPGSLRVLLG